MLHRFSSDHVDRNYDEAYESESESEDEESAVSAREPSPQKAIEGMMLQSFFLNLQALDFIFLPFLS